MLYFPNQLRFAIGGERVTCRASKLTNSLGWTELTNSPEKQQHELWTRTWSGRASWNCGKVVSKVSEANDFVAFFSSFELGGITKHLMTGRAGNSEFCFPRRRRGETSGNIEGLEETKLTVSLGASQLELINTDFSDWGIWGCRWPRPHYERIKNDFQYLLRNHERLIFAIFDSC